jgi:DNA-binding MarR family transcriptional regulator
MLLMRNYIDTKAHMSQSPEHTPSDVSLPPSPELELETYTLLRQVNSMMDTYNRYDLRSDELTVPQFMIMNYATADGVPLSSISSRMLCDNSNLTGIVDRLISKGYVERRPDPQDRRVSLICLTTLGAEKLRSIRPRHHARVSSRMRSLSPDEVVQLRQLLQALFTGLQDGSDQADTAASQG